MPTPTQDQMWQYVQGLLGRVHTLEGYVGKPSVSLATFEGYFTGLTGWTSYTPTLAQGATNNISKTVTYAHYAQFGKLVAVIVNLSATGSGTANNAVTVSVPVTASAAGNQTVGAGYYFNAAGTSAGNNPGIVLLASTTTMAMIDSGAAGSVLVGQTGSPFAEAVASGDAVEMHAFYEAA